MNYPYFDFFTLVLYILIGLLEYKVIKSHIKHPKGKSLVLGAVLLLLFATSRKVASCLGGMDALNYENIFLNCLNQSLEYDSLEFLFSGFTRTVRRLTGDPVIYRLCCYSLIVCGYFIFIKNFCPREISAIPFVLLIYPFILSFNTMRTSMAISIILIGLVLLKRRRYLCAVVIIMSSVFFHRISIIIVPFLLLYIVSNRLNIFRSRKRFIICLGVLMSIGVVLAKYLQQYMLLFDVLEGNDAYYIERNVEASILSTLASLVPLILIVIFWLVTWDENINKKNNLLALLVFYDIAVFPAAFILGIWRINEYMYIPRLLLWGILLYSFRQRFSVSSRQTIDFTFLLAFSVWLIDRINAVWDPAGLMPYVLIWF